MKVKFKKLHDLAVLPSYAKPGDAGMDITTIEDGSMIRSENGQDLWYYVRYKTGLAVEIPEGFVGLLFPRSSISKYALFSSNAVAVIDSGYRGEMECRFKIDAGIVSDSRFCMPNPAVYKKGDRIGQLVILPYPIIEPEFVDELSTSERGTGGFGSSNIKKESV
jgi:dUTP pyrophosphatase